MDVTFFLQCCIICFILKLSRVSFMHLLGKTESKFLTKAGSEWGCDWVWWGSGVEGGAASGSGWGIVVVGPMTGGDW